MSGERENRRLAPQEQNKAPQAPNMAPQTQGQALDSTPQSQGQAACGVATAQAVGSFAALGNRFLLDGQLLQVQVSRRDFRYKRVPKLGGGCKIARDENGAPLIELATASFDETCEHLLTAAKHGTTLISPCVSDGEREIARRKIWYNMR